MPQLTAVTAWLPVSKYELRFLMMLASSRENNKSILSALRTNVISFRPSSIELLQLDWIASTFNSKPINDLSLGRNLKIFMQHSVLAEFTNLFLFKNE